MTTSHSAEQQQDKIMVAEQGDNQLSSAAFINEFFSLMPEKLPISFGKTTSTTVENIGQVKELNIPNNWTELPRQPSIDGTTFTALQDTKHPDAKLCFFYRGEKVDETNASAFHDLLKQPDHILNKAEFEAMAPIMRNKNNPEDFALSSAYTTSINGKRVLAVEGRFTPQDVDTVALYVDSDGKGAAVQEIYYQGPKKELVSLVQAKKAMKDIQWQ
jgi:hypothetical protein